jgi:phosphoglycolate phosphatase
MRVDAILFDLDGTLIDSAPTISSILNGMRQELGKPPHNIQRYREWVSLGAEELIILALEVSGNQVTVLLEKFRTIYKKTPTPENTVNTGVTETLTTLLAADIRLAICSNKPTLLCEKILKETQLKQYFSYVVGGGATARPKPSRDPIDCALTAMKISHDRALLVGDSTVDQGAAKAAGIPFIFFTNGYNDGVIEELASASIGRINDLLMLDFFSDNTSATKLIKR